MNRRQRQAKANRKWLAIAEAHGWSVQRKAREALIAANRPTEQDRLEARAFRTVKSSVAIIDAHCQPGRHKQGTPLFNPSSSNGRKPSFSGDAKPVLTDDRARYHTAASYPKTHKKGT